MKYLMLDTNIYLDLFISRNKNITPSQTCQYFTTILNHEECTLIIPEIVIKETFDNLNNELKNISNKLSNLIKEFEKIYWINEEEVCKNEEISNVINTSVKEIKKIKELFKTNEDNYHNEIKKRLNNIFYHENSIIIKCDDKLINKVIQRKIFKKRPFSNNKDEYADSLIIETLINIKNYIEIDSKDHIYFISRNSSDFSDSSDKCQWHNHILEDLKINRLDKIVTYSLMFYKTLKYDFDLEYIDSKCEELNVFKQICPYCEKESFIYDDKTDLFNCLLCNKTVESVVCEECQEIMPICYCDPRTAFYGDPDDPIIEYECKNGCK